MICVPHEFGAFELVHLSSVLGVHTDPCRCDADVAEGGKR